MKISLVTITYNSEKNIEETILSIIQQDYDDIEYIIIDGGSTDNTLNIIEKYKDHIAKFISEPDKGISDAFNKGIELSTGQVVGLINSDDFLQKGAIKALAEFIGRNDGYDVYYGNSLMFSEKQCYVYRPGSDLTKLPLYMILSHPATFIKRDAYLKYGKYSLDYKCAMDFDLISDMYCRGAKFIYFDSVLTCFRAGGVSKVNSKKTDEESYRIAVRNGLSPTKVKAWYLKRSLKSRLLVILEKTGLEMLLRSKIKKQKIIDPSEIHWVRKE